MKKHGDGEGHIPNIWDDDIEPDDLPNGVTVERFTHALDCARDAFWNVLARGWNTTIPPRSRNTNVKDQTNVSK